MKALLFALLIAINTQAAEARRTITEIWFAGDGVVTSSQGTGAPQVGQPNHIAATIFFPQPISPYYIAADATGVYGLDRNLTFQDSYNICPRGQICFGSITLDQGQLVDFSLAGTSEGWSFQIDNGTFSARWLDYDANNQVIGINQYAGTWELGLVRITTGVVPEPASWAMLITGFGLIGGAIRTRRAGLRRTTAGAAAKAIPTAL